MAQRKKTATSRRKRSKTTPTSTRPRTAPAALTPEQDARYSAMRRAGITQKDISDELESRGINVARQTVNYVVRNRFMNDDVITVFCELTKTKRKEMWPEEMFAPAAAGK